MSKESFEVSKEDEKKLLELAKNAEEKAFTCLLYTSDAADERSSVDLGGRRIIKKKKERHSSEVRHKQ